MSRRQVHLSSRKHSRFQSLVHLTLCSHLMEHSRFRSFSYWSSFSYLVRCRAAVSKLNSNESKFIQYFSFSAHDEVCHILHQRETNFDGQMQGQFFFSNAFTISYQWESNSGRTVPQLYVDHRTSSAGPFCLRHLSLLSSILSSIRLDGESSIAADTFL